MTIEDEPGAAQAKEKPSLNNPAVARCYAAGVAAYRAGIKVRNDEQTRHFARDHANEAYRQSMPPLSGADNIRDFIACVTYGMIIGTINPYEASRFLYAAQVAGNLARRRPQKKPKNIRATPVSRVQDGESAQKSA